ncbi:hypothetical protein GA0070558_1359 [Micromonospora haikouensis]|uniref:DUF5709 domain-containing protein n=1 Tax=Micromonospora haikouensis TaxID=686309 RepID=A0A1C4Y4J0_9ACTN|nr:DUF5709 domain-containing protein [Micromonospora haikouensis]SCF15622.1 hypothetical protein GA0070558_1359 [Micromonospora haikouensis]
MSDYDGPDESGVLQPEDSLDDRGVADVLDEGWSPAERPWAVDDWGTTAREQEQGESLAGRLRRELPEGDDWAGDGLGDASDTDGELIDDEVGDRRAGRLVSAYGGDDSDSLDLYATDIGVDGAAASAEEAAMHVVSDRDY